MTNGDFTSLLAYLQAPGIAIPTVLGPPTLINNGSVIVAGATTASVLASIAWLVKKVLTEKKVITEEWHDKEAPGALDRARRQFSDARTGLKAWAKRHKKDLKMGVGIAGLGVALAFLASNSKNSKTAPVGTTGAMPGALWGGTPTTSGWSSILHGDR